MDEAILHLKRSDPVIGDIIDRVGPYRLRRMESNFHGLARSIVFQQLSGKAAGTIHARLLAATSDPLTPGAVLRLNLDELRALGLSKQKATYIRDLAEKTAAGAIQFEAMPHLSDDEIIRELTLVKGVGVWTAHMFLIFALERPDILPVGDLGIRNAIQRAYRMRKPPTPDKMHKLARNWRPYCSVASWYLWRSLELPKKEA